MSKVRRQLKTAIFIACEGKNTEPVYFESMAEDIAGEDYFAVTVYPDSSDEAHKSHGLGLVQEAQSRMADFDEVWAVFDKDGYTKHPEAFALANTPINGKVVNIAFSSIAFEQWVLLHFTKSAVAYAKSADIIDQFDQHQYFDGYEKTAYFDTYSKLKDKTIIALENSAWLKHQLALAGVLPAGPLHVLNPYTDVDVLVRRLLRIDEAIHWTAIGQVITEGAVTCLISVTSTTTLTVTLTNNGPVAIIYNQANVANHFYLLDAARQIMALTIAATDTVDPGQTNAILLTSPVPLAGHFFNYRQGRIRIMAQL